MRRFLLLFPCLLIGLTLVGCETGITYPEDDKKAFTETVTFGFTIDAEELGTGKSVPVISADVIDLRPMLEGYNLADIETATVSSVDLVRGSPQGINLNAIMTSARLVLRVSETNFVTVANTTAMPAADRIKMEVVEKNEVRKVINQPAFGAALEVRMREDAPAQSYGFTARVVLSIEVDRR